MDADIEWDPAGKQETDSNNMVQTRSHPQPDKVRSNFHQTQPDHASNVCDVINNSPSKDVLPFLSLPGEIRNCIYKYPCIYMYSGRTTLRYVQGSEKFRLDDGIQPPITRVNRQLRRETLEIFYSEHPFHLEMVFPRDNWIYFAVPFRFKTLNEKWNRGQLDPGYGISRLLRRFTPRLGATIQPSNLRFLTQLSVAMEVPLQYSLGSRLMFTMSATVIDIKKDVERPAFWACVKTDYLDWNDRGEVRAACVKGISSFPGWIRYMAAFGDIYLSPWNAPRSGEASDTVDKLACGVGLITRHVPQLANNVYAYFEINSDFLVS